MYQQLTNEVRTLLRGLALVYGTPDNNDPAGWHPDYLDLAMLEQELALVQDLHPDAGSCGPTKLHVNGNNMWAKHKGTHVFHFGAYGDTHVLAFGRLDGALEDAAETLKEVAPGVFTEPDYEAAEAELKEDPEWEEDPDQVHEHAETDLTYTESGWLLSHEWTVTSFDSIADVLAWVYSSAR